MAQMNQLVGIIELDAEPDLDAPLDENIGQTLQRLRSGAPLLVAGSTDLDEPADSWLTVAESESVVVLKADLGRLLCDLESELARLLDRLLVVHHH